MDFVVRALLSLDMLLLWISVSTEPLQAVNLEPMFDSPMANVTVKEMTKAVLPCSVKYLGKRQVIWTDKLSTVLTFEERRVIDDNRLSVERPFVKDWNLHIRNVRHRDQGMYNCLINTNPVKIKVVYLTVKVPAKILNNSSPDNIRVQEGKTVTLQCNVTGIPPPTVTWHRLSRDEKGETKKSEFCTSTNKIGMSGEVLVIHNISRHCGDIYECSADNKVPPAVSRFITVSVEFVPEVTMPNSRLGQILGKETILECQVAANPQGGAIWKKNGLEMKTMSGKYRLEMYPENSISVIISLRISFLEQSDYGTYTCEAYNQLGNDSGTMVLYEYVVPKVRSTTTTTTTTTTTPMPGIPPYKTRVIHPSRHNHNHNHHQQQQQQQQQQHNDPQHHNHNNNHHQQYQHGSNAVVVGESYDLQDKRYQSGYNNGKPQSKYEESMSGDDENGADTSITKASSLIINLFVALVILVLTF